MGIFVAASAGLYRLSQRYAPSNRIVNWIRTPRGVKWGVPIAALLVPAYLFAASVVLTIIESGGSAWLSVLVLLFIWNALRFAMAALWSVVMLALQLVSTAVNGRFARPS